MYFSNTLRQLMGGTGRGYVSLDNLTERSRAKNGTALFLLPCQNSKALLLRHRDCLSPDALERRQDA